MEADRSGQVGLPPLDQLEIVTSSGAIEFWDLDPARGITNIGRNQGNDIMLDGSGVAPFHAVLDHRHKPYHLTVLAPAVVTRVNGESVPVNVPREVQPWDNIEIGNNVVILFEGATLAGSPVPAVASPAMPVVAASRLPFPSVAEVPTTVLSSPQAEVLPERGMAPPSTAASRPADHTDDVIVADLSERNWIVDVDQTATFQVTVANGGAIVAAFWVWIEGLDQSWVTISPPQVNLNEGERAVVTVSITPPRHPSSRAGMHHFAVVVHSPNYPDRRCHRGATLTVNPYYEYAVGDLSPKQQAISYSRRAGIATLPVMNKGNSRALFRLEGADDERACSFEFQVPGEEVNLATQAEMRLQPEEMVPVPVHITPLVRKLVALRRHTYSYTVTTSMVDGAQVPRMVLGQIKAASLIGFWHLLLMMLLVMSCLFFVFIPGTQPRLYSEQGGRVSAVENDVLLSYNASRFAGLSPKMILNTINAWTASLSLERKLKNAPDNTYEVVAAGTPLAKPDGTLMDAPVQDVVYRLTVRNWPSAIFPSLAASTTYDVGVVPVVPTVDLQPRETQVEIGKSVVLKWNVEYANRLLLKTKDGLIVETINDPPASGSYEVKPDTDTVYVLEAYNLYTGDSPETAAATVKVFVPPTATPPPPVVEYFMAQPDRIVEGTPVTFNWRVSNSEDVSIESDDPTDRPVQVGPAGPPISRQPTRTTLYTLKAVNGAATAVAYQQVYVQPAPTATPVPLAPVIEFFTVTPNEIVAGETDTISLAWSVTGNTTNIQITGPDFPTVTGLGKQDTLDVTVAATTLFVLTASNGDLSTSQTVQIKVTQPTGTPEPTPAPPPPPTATTTPVAPNVVFFKAAAADADDDDKVSFISDDPATYEVVAGTKINLSWDVQNAVRVTLLRDGASLGDQPLAGSLPQTIKSDANYSLAGQNARGDLTTTQLHIDVKQLIPSPPSNLTGETGADSITLSWDYSTQGESSIIGFRIYRANLPPGDDFKRVAKEGDLTSDVRDWTDSVTPTCGRVYYAVAVYHDVVKEEDRETPASSNSWASSSCP